jgi:hypothetical protein
VKTSRMRRTLAVLMTVAGSMLAIGAAPALAEVHYSNTGSGAKVSGSLTVYKGGSNAVTCTAPSAQFSSFPDEATLRLYSFVSHEIRFSCPNGKALGLDLETIVAAATDSVEIWSWNPYAKAPWSDSSSYWNGFSPEPPYEVPAVVGFVNGSGSTPSKLVFDKTHIGTSYDKLESEVTASGTLNLTTSSGGLLTIEE